MSALAMVQLGHIKVYAYTIEAMDYAINKFHAIDIATAASVVAPSAKKKTKSVGKPEDENTRKQPPGDITKDQVTEKVLEVKKESVRLTDMSFAPVEAFPSARKIDLPCSFKVGRDGRSFDPVLSTRLVAGMSISLKVADERCGQKWEVGDFLIATQNGCANCTQKVQDVEQAKGRLSEFLAACEIQPAC